jgi:hypothetical protein
MGSVYIPRQNGDFYMPLIWDHTTASLRRQTTEETEQYTFRRKLLSSIHREMEQKFADLVVGDTGVPFLPPAVGFFSFDMTKIRITM